MDEVRAVLLEVAHAGGRDRAGVVIDGQGDVWLQGSLTRDDGAVLLTDHRPLRAGEDGERTVLGGRLPAAAASVEAVSVDGDRIPCLTGSGAWLVELAQPPRVRDGSDPVLFRDPGGTILVPSLPPEWTREPLPDVAAGCAACGSSPVWDLLTPTDRSRGIHEDGTPRPVALCRACGHEESLTASSSIPGDAAELAGTFSVLPHPRRRDGEELREISQQVLLAAASFPVYGVEGWPARVAGSTSHGEDIGGVTIAHGSEDRRRAPALRVTTELSTEHDGIGAAEWARLVLGDWLREPIPPAPGASLAAQVLGGRAAAARAHLTAREAGVDGVPIPVDGQAIPFAAVEVAGRWAAVARLEGRLITVAATGVAPDAIRLRAIPDPAAGTAQV